MEFIFCTEDQITEESLSVTNLILEIYKNLGFEKGLACPCCVFLVCSAFPRNNERRVVFIFVWDDMKFHKISSFNNLHGQSDLT